MSVSAAPPCKASLTYLEALLHPRVGTLGVPTGLGWPQDCYVMAPRRVRQLGTCGQPWSENFRK